MRTKLAFRLTLETEGSIKQGEASTDHQDSALDPRSSVMQ